MPPRRPPPLRLALLALLAAPALAGAQAQPMPPPGGVADFTGARSLGLAAATGVASGNDGLFVNPAAIAVFRRYSAETLFGLDRRGATNVGKYVGFSVVDALSSPVAGGLAWVRPLEGDESGNLFVGALAGELASRLYLGAQLRYYGMRVTEGGLSGQWAEVVTADAGLFWVVSDYLTFGASGFNLIDSGHPGLAPRTAGAGLSLGSDRSVKLVADWRADFDSVRDPATGAAVTTNRYAAGLEALLGDAVPLRAGFLRDETLGGSWWSAGAGLIAASGVAIDAGYRQSLDAPDARVFALTFKLQRVDL